MMSGLYRLPAFVPAFLALVGGLAVGCHVAPGDAAIRVVGQRRIMGVPWRITVHAPARAAGAAAIAAAFAEVERLERVLSDYDPTSELARLSAAAPTDKPVAVGADLWRVLVAAEEIREQTDGAFDISVGPLTALWRQARRSGRPPREDKLAAARAAVGAGAVELETSARAVRLPRAGARLDPGGIGMGYAADRALEILAARGIASAMIDASGDILVSAPPPGATGWRIEVAPLRPGGEAETVILAHAAVTTSGDAHQAVEIAGVRHSHVVDPRTGIGVVGPTTASVIAPTATIADALATAASVLGHDAGPAVIARFPGCAARFCWTDGGEVRVATTAGWPAAAGAAPGG